MQSLDVASTRSGDANLDVAVLTCATERWFVVQMHPRKEAYAAINLERQKFGCFWPRFRKNVNHARRNRQILAPLFPGYLFVRFDPATDPWRCVNSTYGVGRLVSGRDQVPVPVPRKIMDHFLRRCEGGILQSSLAELTPGQEVKIASGPFVERLARIMDYDDIGRVAILLEVMGQDQVLNVRSYDLALI